MAEITPTQAAFAELNKAIQIADYKQVLKTANKILHHKDSNTDEKAMHCKVVAFIHMDMFVEALKYIEQTSYCNQNFIFEKAYCQYRLLQTEKALDTLEESRKSDIPVLELKAQILYKLGFYGEAFKLYRQLIKDCADDYDEERKTNLMASHAAQILWQDAQNVDLGLSTETYEQMYNKACSMLGEQKFDDAMELLKRAIETCRETFADDEEATEEEIESEIAVLKVQQGFALQMLGRNDEALSVYNQVIKLRPSDVALVAVASNNIISINKEQNVFDSKKKLRATTASGVEQKLTSHQMKNIEFNRALLHMYSNQWDACRKLLRSLQRRYKDSDIPCLIQAAQFVREKNHDKAISYLKEFIEQYSDPDISNLDLTNVKMALVQILVSHNKNEEAAQVLTTLGSISSSLAVVSAIVALRGKDDQHQAVKILDNAIEWHKEHNSEKDVICKLLWKSAEWHLKTKNPQKAAEKLEEMRLHDGSDLKVLAQLISTYSQFNQEKAHQISENLPSMEELSVDVDVDELERSSSLFTPRYVKRQKQKMNEKKENVIPTKTKHGKEIVSENRPEGELKIKKKKKKKNKPAKNIEPGSNVDPERWMPLRERSYYKGRRKDRRKGVGKGTQGTTAGASDQFDITKTSFQTPASPKAGANSSKNTPVNSPKPGTVPPQSVKPKAAQAKQKPKKKKKKGGW